MSTPAEKSFARIERSEKDGDFLSGVSKKYYLFLTELLALYIRVRRAK